MNSSGRHKETLLQKPSRFDYKPKENMSTQANTVEQLRTRAADWATSHLGVECLHDVVERSRKSVEEAAEFAQAVGLDESEALRIVMHVFSKKPGVVTQELAGCLMTVLLSATALNQDLFRLMSDELSRVELVSPDMIQAKQEQKFQAGISAYRGR
jgi:hydroxypyruvate isomerase